VGVVAHVHSDWLELALQCGLVGAGLVFLAAAAFLLESLGTWWTARSREMRAVMGERSPR